MKIGITNISISLSCLVFILIISNCSGHFKPDNINNYIFDTDNFKFIDLSLSLNKLFAEKSNKEKLNVRLADENNPRHNWIDLCEKEWIGTTLDLRHKYDPLYYAEHSDEKTLVSQQNHVDSLPLESLIVPLIIVDVSNQVRGNSNFILEKYHLDFMLNNYFGNTAQPCIIVFKFGWSMRNYDTRSLCRSIDRTNTTLETPSPGISEEVAKWITTNYKNVIGVGVDLPSVDSLGTSKFIAHNTLVDAGLYVVTNVDLEQYIPDAWCTAILLPQADQRAKAPVRFVAICPKSKMEGHETRLHRL